MMSNAHHERSRPSEYYELAVTAMNNVAALAMDPAFLHESSRRRLKQEIYWTTPDATAQPFLLSRHTLFSALSSPFLRTEIADKKAPYVTMSAPQISLSLAKDRPAVTGTLIIDHREVSLDTLLTGETILRHDEGVIGEVTPHDLKNILFCILLSKAQDGSLPAASIHHLLDKTSRMESEWDELAYTLSQMGNLSGESTVKEYSLFRDAADTEAFVSILTRSETPRASFVDHFVQATTHTEVLTQQWGIEKTSSSIPIDNDSEVAYSAPGKPTNTAIFALSAMANHSVRDIPGAHTYASTGDGAHDYARICQQFLDCYERLRQ